MGRADKDTFMASPTTTIQRMRRVGITLGWFGLGVVILPLSLIGLAAFSPEFLKAAWMRHGDLDTVSKWQVMAVFVPTAMVWGLAWILRRKSASAMVLGASAVCVGLSYGYLMWDDAAIRHPGSYEAFSPSIAGDAERNEVLMRYSARHLPGQPFKAPRRFSANTKLREREASVNAEADQAWLTENREAIEADWEELREVRGWLDEISSWPRIPDLTTDYNSEMLAFAPIRAVTQRAAGIARIRAIEGEGEAAVAVILPVIHVARRLEMTSRTMVRTMIARLMLKAAVKELEFVLDRCVLAPATRATLVAALREGNAGHMSARRMIESEYIFAQSALSDIANGERNAETAMGVRSIPQSLFLNRRRSINLYWDVNQLAQEQIGSRQLDRFDEHVETYVAKGSLPFKNLAGRNLTLLAQPSFAKVGKHFWEIEDARLAVIERLEALGVDRWATGILGKTD